MTAVQRRDRHANRDHESEGRRCERLPVDAPSAPRSGREAAGSFERGAPGCFERGAPERGKGLGGRRFDRGLSIELRDPGGGTGDRRVVLGGRGVLGVERGGRGVLVIALGGRGELGVARDGRGDLGVTGGGGSVFGITGGGR